MTERDVGRLLLEDERRVYLFCGRGETVNNPCRPRVLEVGRPPLPLVAIARHITEA
jgi:hypothetical protein